MTHINWQEVFKHDSAFYYRHVVSGGTPDIEFKEE